jgi:hypothetical protein
MLVGMVVVAGRLEREGRSRSCKGEETERPSACGGEIPSSEKPESSSSGPAMCPLTGSTDDGWIVHKFSKEADGVGHEVLTRGGGCGFGAGFAFTCWAELVMNAGWFVLM